MSVLSKSAEGASFLILFQLASRASTFLVNQILLRYLSPETLGLSAQLDLFARTVISFSRDSFEVAAQRHSQGTQAIVNLAFLSIAFGAPLAYGLAATYVRTDVSKAPYFKEALWVYAVSSVIELLATPAYVAAQQRLLFKVKASAESIATVCRCLLTCGVAIFAARVGFVPGVLPFAAGQLAFGTMMLLVYIYKMLPVAKKDKFSLLPRRMSGDEYIGNLLSKKLCKLSLSLFIQNSFKFVLTQGDGILIATLASLADQGAYALASNYGGLIARMLFQPIEETSRTIFGQLCGSTEQETKGKNPDIKKEVIKREKENIGSARQLLENVLKLYFIIGLVAITLGPTAAPILLRLVAGKQWADTQASSVLVTYCYYIPLLAINGVTEAFVTAVASNKVLHLQSALMGVWFFAFAGTTWWFMRVLDMGARGLVFANCVNMTLRIGFNTWFFNDYFEEKEEPFNFGIILPHPTSFAAAVGTWAILRANVAIEITGNALVNELVSRAAPMVVFGIVLSWTEQNFLLPYLAPIYKKVTARLGIK